MTDPYQELGVDKNADLSQIKKAYRKLAKQYHPDINKNEGADKKFQDIQSAYEILSNSDKKQQYDTFGSSAFNGTAGGPGGPGAAGNPFGGNPFGDDFQSMHIDLNDIFNAFTGGGRSRNSSRRGGSSSYFTEYVGEHVEIVKSISLKDAVFGKEIEVSYTALDQCEPCSGSGLKPKAKKSTCPTCHGTGTSVNYLQGGFQMASTCHTCGGNGVVIKNSDACTSCHGSGVSHVSKKTEINIPCGISNGTRLKVSGEGDSPNTTSGPNVKLRKGDLFVKIRVEPHPNFVPSGLDLKTAKHIPMTTAALGGTVEVPTLDGETIRLKVKPGTQPGNIFSIPEKGIPRLGKKSSRGDLKIEFVVDTLRPTSATQTALLEALADAFDDTTATRADPSWKSPSKSTEPKAEAGTEAKTESKAESQESSKRDEDTKTGRIEKFLSDAFKRIIKDK